MTICQPDFFRLLELFFNFLNCWNVKISCSCLLKFGLYLAFMGLFWWDSTNLNPKGWGLEVIVRDWDKIIRLCATIDIHDLCQSPRISSSLVNHCFPITFGTVMPSKKRLKILATFWTTYLRKFRLSRAYSAFTPRSLKLWEAKSTQKFSTARYDRSTWSHCCLRERPLRVNTFE